MQIEQEALSKHQSSMWSTDFFRKAWAHIPNPEHDAVSHWGLQTAQNHTLRVPECSESLNPGLGGALGRSWAHRVGTGSTP